MSPQSLSAAKRRAILDAALTEFEAGGYRETSMDRIATTAQVSKRTVYNHFENKQALFDAIAVQLIERVQKLGERPYAPAHPIAAQLTGIGEEVLDMLASPSFLALARVTLVELIRSPDLACSTYELFRARRTGLASWLEQASGDGRLRVEDPVRAADQFLGLINAFALWPQLLGNQPAPGREERRRILDGAVAMLLQHYAPQDAAMLPASHARMPSQ